MPCLIQDHAYFSRLRLYSSPRNYSQSEQWRSVERQKCLYLCDKWFCTILRSSHATPEIGPESWMFIPMSSLCSEACSLDTVLSLCKQGSQSHALADTQQSTASIQDLSMGIKAKRTVVCVVHNLKITRIPNCMEYYVCTSCISMYTEWSWHQWWDKEESHWILWVPGKYCFTRIMLTTLYVALYCGPLDIRWQLTSSCHGLSYSRYIFFQNPGLLLLRGLKVHYTCNICVSTLSLPNSLLPHLFRYFHQEKTSMSIKKNCFLLL